MADHVATEIGQKILITDGMNTFTKSPAFSGLYKQGSVLTVKKFSSVKHKYMDAYHIAEVEEFDTPEGEPIAIFVGEFKLCNHEDRYERL